MYVANAAPRHRLQVRIGIAMMREFIAACVAATPCLIPQPNLIPAADGRVFGNPINPKMSCREPTPVTAWHVWKRAANNVARTSGIYSPTARNPPGYASASILPHLSWTKINLPPLSL